MKLPPGVQREGTQLRVDLRQCVSLREPGGVVEIRALRVALVRGKRRIRALCLTCPHKPKKEYRVQTRCSEGRISFRCGAHGWTWNRKGKATGKAKKHLPRLTVTEAGDDHILVSL